MTERGNYLRQIRRLQAENAILRAVVAQERLRRQAAWGWYVKKLNSRIAWLADLMLIQTRWTRVNSV